jgi:hypothetical protein
MKSRTLGANTTKIPAYNMDFAIRLTADIHPFLNDHFMFDRTDVALMKDEKKRCMAKCK